MTMCTMCDSAPESFQDFDLDIVWPNGRTELYVSAGETMHQAAFLSGFKMASREILDMLMESGFLTAGYAVDSFVGTIGKTLVEAEIKMVERQEMTVADYIRAIFGDDLTIIDLSDQEEPASAEEEETYPEDEMDDGLCHCELCE